MCLKKNEIGSGSRVWFVAGVEPWEAERLNSHSSCSDLPSSSQLVNFYLNNWTRSQQDRLLRSVSKTNSEGLRTFHHPTSDLINSPVKTDGNVIFLGGNSERLWNAQIQLTKNMNLKCGSNRTTLVVDADHHNALFCSLASTYSQPKWYSQTLERSRQREPWIPWTLWP